MASAINKISAGLRSFSTAPSRHQLFVDVQAAGGIDDQRIAAHIAGLAAGLGGQSLDERRAGGLILLVAFVEFGFNGLGDDLELLASGGR